MSKDASHTYIHLHASHHADLFEEFCRPPSANPTGTFSSNNSSTNPKTSHTAIIDPSDPSLAHVPGHFLPFESINLPPHLMPINPEDEDGVVPDMHAAFGIARAMGQSAVPEISGERSGRGVAVRPEDVWRDFGLEELVVGVGGLGVREGGVEGVGMPVRSARPGGSGTSSGVGAAGGVRREGRRGGILSVR